MWQHIVKSYRITTKVDVDDKYSLAAFKKAALIFVSIIVMLVVASLNIISVDAAAAAAAYYCDGVAMVLRWCRR